MGYGNYRILKDGETPTILKPAPVPPPSLPPKDDRIFLTPKEKAAFDLLNTVNKQTSSGEFRVVGGDFLGNLDEEEEKKFLAKMKSLQILGGAIGNGEKGPIFPFSADAYLQSIGKVVVTAAASLPHLIKAAEAELQTLAKIVREAKKGQEKSRKQVTKAEANLESSKQELSQLEQKAAELRTAIATLAAEIEKIRRETAQQDPRLADPQKALTQVRSRLALLKNLAKLPEEERARFLCDLK